jgi:hypothetical protein
MPGMATSEKIERIIKISSRIVSLQGELHRIEGQIEELRQELKKIIESPEDSIHSPPIIRGLNDEEGLKNYVPSAADIAADNVIAQTIRDRILKLLNDRPKLWTTIEIAEQIKERPETVSSTVSRMVENGLIKRLSRKQVAKIDWTP